ncbi:histidine kinase dimerization/phospho-acceptor domain-containing protein [Comamonas resistens]
MAWRGLSNQRAFTYVTAHDLRTPLTVMDTHLQLARISESTDETGRVRNS